MLTGFPARGYIYLLPKGSLRQGTGDSSEYICEKSICPAKRIVFDTKQVAPLFRQHGDIHEIVDQTTGEIKKEGVRGSDLDAALLTIRNMIQLAGPIYNEASLNSQWYFLRLAAVVKNLAPVFQRAVELCDQRQAALLKDVLQTYRTNTLHLDYDAPHDIQSADWTIRWTLGI